jgi:hypothetical protein
MSLMSENWPRWIETRNGRQQAQNPDHARGLTGLDWQEDGTVSEPIDPNDQALHVGAVAAEAAKLDPMA